MPSPGFQGEIAGVQCGVGGLNANLNPSKIQLKNVIQAEGAVFRQDHWRKEPGTALYGTNTASGGVPIIALNDWHPIDTVQRIVHLAQDGKVYYTDNVTGQTGDPGAHVFATQQSANPTTFGFWVTGGQDPSAPTIRKNFLFRKNKGLSVMSEPGGVPQLVAVSNPAADWINGGADAHPPIVGIINGGGPTSAASQVGGRLVVSGVDSNPHLLYFSRDGNQEIFNDVDATIPSNSQTFSVFPGIGERIFALVNYKGFIIVFKFPFGIFAMDARDSDPGNWLAYQISDKLGIAPTPYAALTLENEVIFLANDGQFYLLSSVIGEVMGQNNIQAANIGMDMQIYQFLLDAYARDKLPSLQSVYQPFWQTAQFTVTGEGVTQNNTRLVWEFNSIGQTNGEARFSYSYRDRASAIALWRDPDDFIQKPLYGDYHGRVVLMEQDARTAFDGTPYPFRVQTPHSNYGEYETMLTSHFVQFANRNKLWENLEIEYVPFTDATVNVTFFTDGVFKGTKPVKLRAGGKPLGDSQADTDAFIIGDSLLAGGVVRSTVLSGLHVGESRRISFLFENQNDGEDVALTHLYVGFNIGDTKQTPRGVNA